MDIYSLEYKYIMYTFALLKHMIMKTDKIIFYVATGLLTALILAFFAHFMIEDGEQTGALVALILLLISYIFNKRINN